MNKKALFIFFEGLSENVIDSQVLTHCHLMKDIGVEFEIWVFACNENLYQASLSRLERAKVLSNCEVKIFRGLRPAYPFSENINAFFLKQHIDKYKPSFDFIHARTDYSTAVVCKAVKNKRIIYDCRGDSIAEFIYSNKGFFFSKKYRIVKYKSNIKTAKLLSNRAIFVSKFLKDKIQYDKKNEVIGCAADSKLFYFDENLRKKIRKILSYESHHKVLIYSGGMNKYQCFSECVDYFKKLLKKDESWHFLVLTTELKQAKVFIKETKNIILKKVPFNEVNQYLNAADKGLIFREKNDLNRAASPTKFAEYALSGLSIYFSKEIGDLEFYAQQIGIKNQDLNNIHNLKKRQIRAEMAKEFVSKKSVMEQYKNIYL
jgi:hypothetical protein